MMSPAINIISKHPSNSLRLSEKEIALIFEYVFDAHDHTGATPAVPVFWTRSRGYYEA